MVLETLAAKVGLDAAKEALSALRRRSTKKQFAAYLSAAVTELLALHPDIDLAEAKILAAEAIGEPHRRNCSAPGKCWRRPRRMRSGPVRLRRRGHHSAACVSRGRSGLAPHRADGKALKD
jgi:hypothetical protein